MRSAKRAAVGALRARALAAATAVISAACLAQAQTVYHSPNDDGVNPGTPLELRVGPWESVFLFLDAGSEASQSGVACSDGDGDELCGWEVLVKAEGPASFADFFPEPGVVHRLTPDEFEANGLLAVNPALGPVRIGELKVSSSDTGGEIVVKSGQTVLAALQVVPVPETVLATTPEPMPEPGVSLGLAAGALLIAGLARRRSLRAGGAFHQPGR